MIAPEDVRPRRKPAQGIARTELEVGADVLARLIRRRMIRDDEEAFAALERETQVPAFAIKAAIDHQQRFGYRSPRVSPAEDPGAPMPEVSEAEKQMSAKRSAGQHRRPGYQAKNPNPGKRICAACRHEFELSKFLIKKYTKAGRPIYHHQCENCRKSYAKRRYLSVKAEAVLGTLIEFVLEHDDPVSALGCPYCTQPLEAGQSVAGAVRLAHADCLAGTLAQTA